MYDLSLVREVKVVRGAELAIDWHWLRSSWQYHLYKTTRRQTNQRYSLIESSLKY